MLDYNIHQPDNWLKVYGYYDQNGHPITSQWDVFKQTSAQIRLFVFLDICCNLLFDRSNSSYSRLW